jgi:hypothetical protein
MALAFMLQRIHEVIRYLLSDSGMHSLYATATSEMIYAHLLHVLDTR